MFKLYLIVGGFPEAVVNYINTNNLQNVYKVHETIDKGYRFDISKYDNEHSLLIKDIYDLIPSELSQTNKRFILKNLNEKARFYNYEDSFEHKSVFKPIDEEKTRTDISTDIQKITMFIDELELDNDLFKKN